MKFVNKHIVKIIAVILIICASNINWGGSRWKNVIGSDGKGYYAYLPATLIYHDLNLGFFDVIEQQYYSKNTYYDYRASDVQGHVFDKYYCGTAVLMLPFFLTAHVLSMIFGFPLDGYSMLYPICINIGSIFYLALALFYLKHLLKFYTGNEMIITFVLIAFTFGTNIFYYTISESAMSHIYSFFCITALLYHFRILCVKFDTKQFYCCAAFFGLIILIRPVNGLVLLALPFISGNKESMISCTKEVSKNILAIIISLVIVSAIISLQLIAYKIETGTFFVDAYRYEHFNWRKPELFNILFSYKKGLFLYTPLILLSFAGLFFLFYLLMSFRPGGAGIMVEALVYVPILSFIHCLPY